jgi:hypothetical protein
MSLPATAVFPGQVASEANLLNEKNIVPSQTTNITLAAAMAAGDTSCTLATGTGAQLYTDNFVVSIDDEIIFVGTRSGDTLSNLTRGFESTTATSHANGVVVYPRITALAHNQLVSEIVAIEAQLGANLGNVVKSSTLGANNGTATLDSGGHLTAGQVPTNVLLSSQVGAVSGVAGLDSGGHVPSSQLNSKLYSLNVTSVTVNGAVTTDQVLMTKSLAAGDWDVANRTMRITGSGILSGQSSATNITFKLQINGVVTLTSPLATVTGLTNVDWWLDVYLVRTSTGTTGKTSIWGVLCINNSVFINVRTLNVAWDGTVAQTFQFAVAYSTASASNSCTQEIMAIKQEQ